MRTWQKQLPARKLLALIGLTILLPLSACAAHRTDLLAGNHVTLEIIPFETQVISLPTLYQGDGELVVYGKMDIKSGFCRSDPWVDIAILDPNGTVQHTVSMPN
ncbi:MAG: hypothetical protein C4523_18435 [Myxococcales bacterium]|nr:MAG: hypothetical protein C4523_18435 [Myxococcales bacterium]